MKEEKLVMSKMESIAEFAQRLRNKFDRRRRDEEIIREWRGLPPKEKDNGSPPTEDQKKKWSSRRD